MTIEELEKMISKTESLLNELISQTKPLQNKIADIEEITHETNKEYTQKIQEIYEEQKAFNKAQQDVKHDIQKQVWDIQTESSKIQAQLSELKKDHGAALMEISAQQRLEEIYSKLQNWFEDSPWSAHIKDFQREDVLAIVMAYEDQKRGILNANVMGSGKTFETGAAFDILNHLFYKEHSRKPLTIWLTRKALVRSTAKELAQWNPDRKFIAVLGNADMRNNIIDIAVSTATPMIANYEIVNTTDKMHDLVFDFVFVDEVHKLKGGEDVKVFINTREITRKSRFFLGLSGSPIQNKPEDIWPIFNILDEERFPTVRRFQREFTRERWDEEKKRFVTGVDEERLLKVMKGQVIKQDPKIVQAAWPDKRRIFRTVEMNGKQRQVYDRCKAGIISYFEGEATENPDKVLTITAVIAQLTYLRQINVFPGSVNINDPDGSSWSVDCEESAKLDEAMDLLEELTGEGEQVVVWSSQFNAPLFELERRLRNQFPELSVATMTGKTPDRDRRGNEEKFQAGEIDILLCNRGAFSEGFNFQKNPGRWSGGASKAIFLDAWWNPKANEQAEDRIWRTGQSENVDIYYIYTDDSVDAFIAAKLDEKEAMVRGIMDSEVLRPADVLGMLSELL